MEKITVNLTAKDLINARTASQKLQSAPEEIVVRGLAVLEDTDKTTGDKRPVGYLVSETGDVYGTVSATAIDTISAVAQAVNDGDLELPLTFRVQLRTSAAGRNFITLSIA